MMHAKKSLAFENTHSRLLYLSYIVETARGSEDLDRPIISCKTEFFFRFSAAQSKHMIAATVYFIFWGYDWLNHIDFLVKLSMSKINIVMYGL